MSDRATPGPCNQPAAVVLRPSGWKASGKWWTKPSKYGLRYMCSECGKQALGLSVPDDRRHHWSWCSRLRKTSRKAEQ